MPKEGGGRHKSRAFHPYSKGGATQQAKAEEAEEAASATPKEWEDVTCPICMEFPHNAVLLVCASHDNGCRPYVCDTSYRHSNCFDQYRKLSARTPSSSTHHSHSHSSSIVIHEPLSAAGSSARTRERSAVRMRPLRELLDGSTSNDGAPGRAVRELGLDESGSGLDSRMEASSEQEEQQQEQQEQRQAAAGESVASLGSEPLELLCPLCRGKVIGWKVVEQARRHLNGKTRNCAQEACAFIGSYDELRKHARCTHPFARPSDIDPVRQRDWRHLERERDIGDVLSTIQSAMPGARILGDYVIDEDNEEVEEDGEDNDVSGDEGNWWTVFLLFQVFGPVAQGGATGGAGSMPASSRLRGLSSSSSRAHQHHHHHRHLSRLTLPSSRQALWGEDIQVNQVQDEEQQQQQQQQQQQSSTMEQQQRSYHHRSGRALEEAGAATVAATPTATTTTTTTSTSVSIDGDAGGGATATSAASSRRRRRGRSRTRTRD